MYMDNAIAVYYLWVDRRQGKNKIGLAEITMAIDSLNKDELKLYELLTGAYLMGYKERGE